MRLFSLKALLLSAVAIVPSFAANIVTNPSFEAGNLNSWSYNSHVSFAWGVNGPGQVHSGCIGASCVDQTNLSSANYLYQNLTTQPGSTYSLGFAFAGGPGSPSELRVLWAGSVILDLVNPASDLTSYFVPNLAASDNSTQLMFLSRQDPSFNALTNIDVEAATAPEPGVTGLLLGGLGALGVYRMRRKS